MEPRLRRRPDPHARGRAALGDAARTPCIRFWKGRTLELRDGLKLVSTGGHFEGYQVLHWPAGADGRGALMAGDQPQICMDPKQVTFMYSYPNYIPLNAPRSATSWNASTRSPYDRVYGAFFIRGKGIIPTQRQGGRPPLGRSLSPSHPDLIMAPDVLVVGAGPVGLTMAAELGALESQPGSSKRPRSAPTNRKPW